jgi:BirA family biotin operon repressor/biotin-[acetyl-CoA-carboxylase] ligase
MIGRKIIYKDTLTSTNNYVANKVLLGEIEHGSVILAGNQTDGKGQRASKWDSEPYKNISLSLFVEYANLSLTHLAKINQFVSLACCDFLCEYHPGFKIKWPNDLVYDNKKIGGILIESQLDKFGVKSSIIGIGININQELFGDYNACSLKNIVAKEFSIQDLGFSLIEKLNKRFEEFSSFQFDKLKIDYLDNLWLFQEEKNYFSVNDQKNFTGIIKDIDENGNLIVFNTDLDIIQTFRHKEIVFLERMTN